MKKNPPSPVVRPALWSIESARLHLGISRRQLYRLAAEHELEMLQVGRRPKVTDESLQRYLASLVPKEFKREPPRRDR